MAVVSTGPDGLDYLGFLDIAGWQFAYAGEGKLKPGAKSPNWQKAIDNGVAGIFHRIGNGTSFDESFELGYDAWIQVGGRDSGLEYGAYYYAQPNKLSPQSSVEQIAMWLADYPDLTLRTMLDFEAYNGQVLPPEIMGQWLHDFFRWHFVRYEHQAILYSGNAFANNVSIKGRSFDHLVSVQPRYNRQPQQPPANVKQWAMWPRWNRQPIPNTVIGPWEAWQFSSDGNAQAQGCPDDGGTRIDVNIVPLSHWREMLRPVPPPPPPPPPPEPAPDPGPVIPPSEDDMTLYVARANDGTVWIGDGVTRRPIPGEDVYAVYIFRSGAGSGPKVLDVAGHAAASNPAHLPISELAIIETLGAYS